MRHSVDNADDAILIQRISDAQTDAIRELYDRYYRLVFSVAVAIVGDRSTAEEVTLDVFVHVWRGAHTYRPERGKVSTWLVAITRHHSFDILRREKSHPDAKSLNLDPMFSQIKSDTPEPEQHAENSSQRAQIRDALAQLPAEQRQVLIMAFFKGYTQQEMAELLAQPLGTIKSRVRLAMQKLRQILLAKRELAEKSETAVSTYSIKKEQRGD
jgi:RNA polymerase sigma-70 factor (ECF subfamily)